MGCWTPSWPYLFRSYSACGFPCKLCIFIHAPLCMQLSVGPVALLACSVQVHALPSSAHVWCLAVWISWGSEDANSRPFRGWFWHSPAHYFLPDLMVLFDSGKLRGRDGQILDVDESGTISFREVCFHASSGWSDLVKHYCTEKIIVKK